ncbi:unnamed protein product, partial [Tetraodon nigroviridis]
TPSVSAKVGTPVSLKSQRFTGADPSGLADDHHQNRNAVRARRLRRSHQPFSHWHQEHFDHHQHGVAELLQ